MINLTELTKETYEKQKNFQEYLDNNIEFEYQPDLNYLYTVDGKVYRYYPDFTVEGKSMGN